jgi:hypothetical protein
MKPFAELTGREKAVEILRWLLVPVASFVAVYVLILISQVALPPQMAQPPGTPPTPVSEFQRLVPRVFNVLISGVLVLAGAKMAPRWRVATALALAGLWIGYAFLIHVAVHLGQGTPHWWHFVLSIVASLLAVALIGYAERAQRGRDVPFASP